MEKLRRTMLFVPGNSPGMLQNAGVYGADCVIFDLEDSVAVSEKDTARLLVRNAIKYLDFPCEVGVRINHISTPYGYDDLNEVLSVQPNFIRLPKAEGAKDIQVIDEIISEAEIKYGYPAGSILIMVTIETAKGVRHAYEIATASPRMAAMALGAEDFTADMHTSRSIEGHELMAARGELLLAGHDAGVDVIDAVFPDVDDEEGLIKETKLAKQMGFDGKSVIHPRQIKPIHKVFAPSVDEVNHAKKVVEAYQDALKRKSGVVALNGKMIDGPVVAKAERVLKYAHVTISNLGRKINDD